MAARSIASLTISFGLVSIPVKLYSATQSRAGTSFNLIHKDCGSRLRQQYVCIKEDVIVPQKEIIKGYQFAKDQYVTFTPQELEEMGETSTGSVDIVEFVPEEAIDPIYFDKPYFLAPDKGGSKPYALLAEGMRKTNRCALARWAARGKQYLVQLRAIDEGLILQQLLYADEVRSIADIEIATAPVKETELKLATQLIEQISSEKFDPTAYEDDVQTRITASVEEKVQGQEISISPSAAPEKRGGRVIDLMDALRASLGKGASKDGRASTKKVSQKPPKRIAPESGEPARRKAVRDLSTYRKKTANADR